VKKTICFCLLAWMFSQSSGRAQSGPDATRLEIRGEKREPLVFGCRSAVTTTNGCNGGEPYRATSRQQFVCNTGYQQKECNEQTMVLRKALANYPLAQLGNWTWILVRSEDWKAILRARGLDPDSPAFTFFAKRETFIEEALVTQVPGRNRELLLKWNMSMKDLLDFAIAHELGHALCNDGDEGNADRVARLLEQKKEISCETTSRQKRDHHE
jgi:hypothetical protein